MSRLDYCSPDTLDVARRQRRRRLRWIAILVLAVVHMVLIYAADWGWRYLYYRPFAAVRLSPAREIYYVWEWLTWPVPARFNFGQEALRVWIAKGLHPVLLAVNSMVRAYVFVTLIVLVVRHAGRQRH